MQMLCPGCKKETEVFDGLCAKCADALIARATEIPASIVGGERNHSFKKRPRTTSDIQTSRIVPQSY